ncbi:MAG: hypothetical protein HOY79_19525 [Streptomyces sp.]|nr:hypothetical protein [Streptomyces sp.]
MAKAHRTKVRLWRWRRNPLRRGSDVVEAWVLLGAWVLAVVGGLLAGLVAGGAMQQALDRQRAERHAVSAVLTEDATQRSPMRAVAVADPRVRATVRWTAPDGSVRTAETRVQSGTPTRTRITVWMDERGRLAPKPVSPAAATAQAAAMGLLSAAGAGGVVLVGTRVACIGLNRRRIRQWAQEWERVGTQWGRKAG